MTDEYDEFAHPELPPQPEPAPLQASELKRLDVSSDYFQARLREQAELERISAKVNHGRPDLTAATRVQTELKSATEKYELLPLVYFCSQHVYEWFIDKNPHHIDLVMMVCADHGIEPTPTIIKLASDVARARMTGELSGTPDKILKEHAKRQTFTLMMNLIFAGATLAEAADKAAQWWRNTYPDMDTGKASSLAKDYSRLYRPETEERHFSLWREHLPDDRRDYWQKVRAILPLADAEILGVRR